jgi:hypothetical protein
VGHVSHKSGSGITLKKLFYYLSPLLLNRWKNMRVSICKEMDCKHNAMEHSLIFRFSFLLSRWGFLLVSSEDNSSCSWPVRQAALVHCYTFFSLPVHVTISGYLVSRFTRADRSGAIVFAWEDTMYYARRRLFSIRRTYFLIVLTAQHNYVTTGTDIACIRGSSTSTRLEDGCCRAMKEWFRRQR